MYITGCITQRLNVVKSLLFILLFGLLLLGGCSFRDLGEPELINVPGGLGSVSGEMPSGAGGSYKVGKPYYILKKRYVPEEDYNYSEIGMASWYGPHFHDRLTANGELFDTTKLSAAHRTLPLPSIVRVTNLSNSRSVVVRVNDRGPYSKNRIIDLSRRAAEMLGMIGKGTAKVRVSILAERSKALKYSLLDKNKSSLNRVHTKPVEASYNVYGEDRVLEDKYNSNVSDNFEAIFFYVQVGAFSRIEKAESVRDKLLTLGNENISIEKISVGFKDIYRVRVYDFEGEAVAKDYLEKIKKFNLEGFIGRK